MESQLGDEKEMDDSGSVHDEPPPIKRARRNPEVGGAGERSATVESTIGVGATGPPGDMEMGDTELARAATDAEGVESTATASPENGGASVEPTENAAVTEATGPAENGATATAEPTGGPAIENAGATGPANAAAAEAGPERASLMDLCDDMLLSVFQYLKPRDLKALAFSHPRLATVTRDRTLWQRVDARAAPAGRERFGWMLDNGLNDTTTELQLIGFAREGRGCMGHVEHKPEEDQPEDEARPQTSRQSLADEAQASSGDDQTVHTVKRLWPPGPLPVEDDGDHWPPLDLPKNEPINDMILGGQLVQAPPVPERVVIRGPPEPPYGPIMGARVNRLPPRVHMAGRRVVVNEAPMDNEEERGARGAGDGDRPSTSREERRYGPVSLRFPPCARQPRLQINTLPRAHGYPAWSEDEARASRRPPGDPADPSDPADPPASPPAPACPGPRFTATRGLLRRLAERCPKLTTLALDYCNINCKKVVIGDFPVTLKYLSLRGARCFNLPVDKSYLFKIQDQLPCLEYLDISECQWMDPASILPISKIEKLHTLLMSDCYRMSEFVAYASLATRYGFRTLKRLDLRGTPVGDSEVSGLGWLPALTELHLAPPSGSALVPGEACRRGKESRPSGLHSHKRGEPLPPAVELDDWEMEREDDPALLSSPDNSFCEEEQFEFVQRVSEDTRHTEVVVPNMREAGQQIIEVTLQPTVEPPRRRVASRSEGESDSSPGPSKRKRKSKQDKFSNKAVQTDMPKPDAVKCSHEQHAKALNDFANLWLTPLRERQKDLNKSGSSSSEATPSTSKGRSDVNVGASTSRAQDSEPKTKGRIGNSQNWTQQDLDTCMVHISRPGPNYDDETKTDNCSQTDFWCKDFFARTKLLEMEEDALRPEDEPDMEKCEIVINKSGTITGGTSRRVRGPRCTTISFRKIPRRGSVLAINRESDDSVSESEEEQRPFVAAPVQRPEGNYVRFRRNEDPVAVQAGQDPPNENVEAEPRHHILYVNVGHQLRAVYRLHRPVLSIRHTNRPNVPNIRYDPPVFDYSAQVSDSAISRFGDDDNINIIHLGPDGPVRGVRDLNGRPSRSNLRVLSVNGYRNITDRSLVHLTTAAPHLRVLDVSGTGVTENGVRTFMGTRPECRIIYDCKSKRTD